MPDKRNVNARWCLWKRDAKLSKRDPGLSGENWKWARAKCLSRLSVNFSHRLTGLTQGGFDCSAGCQQCQEHVTLLFSLSSRWRFYLVPLGSFAPACERLLLVAHLLRRCRSFVIENMGLFHLFVCVICHVGWSLQEIDHPVFNGPIEQRPLTSHRDMLIASAGYIGLITVTSLLMWSRRTSNPPRPLNVNLLSVRITSSHLSHLPQILQNAFMAVYSLYAFIGTTLALYANWSTPLLTSSHI